MNNTNQYNNGEQFQQSFNQFGPQAMFQHGFAGTDAQQVRQQNAQVSQGHYGQQGTYQQAMPTMGMGQFGGVQSFSQPGFAGTDAQQVRQQNAQSSQGHYGQQGTYQQGMSTMGMGMNNMGMGQFGGVQSISQPGFAGTDAQQVRQQNAQVSQGHYGQQGAYQQAMPTMGMGMSNMGMGQFGGVQSISQPGFAGTDAQEVRQQNAQSAGGQYQQGGFQQGTQPMGMGMNNMGMGQFMGPQAIFQHGFAGTDAQQVRQQNAQSAQGQYGGMHFYQGGQH